MSLTDHSSAAGILLWVWTINTEVTAAGSSFSSFFLAESTGFPPAAAAAAAAADDDDDDEDDVTGVEVAGLTACTGVDADVLTTDDVLAVADGGFVTDVGALPCSDTNNNTTS